MALFAPVNMEAASKVGGSSKFITRSGIYNVTLGQVIFDINDKGARSLSLYVDHEGEEQVLYSALSLDKFDGSAELPGGMKLFDQLRILTDCPMPEAEAMVLPIGKGKVDKEVTVLSGMENHELMLQMKLSYYKSKEDVIKSRLELKNVFAADGTHVSEIDTDKKPGTQLAKITPYAEDITYNSELTAEDIDAWVAAGRPATAMGATAKAAPKASFGKPSFGKK